MKFLETPRLFVRHLVREDSDRLFGLHSNPSVAQWMGDRQPLTYEQCVKWIDISLCNYQSKGFGASAVVEKNTDEFVGCCGIVYDPERNNPVIPEIIYSFEPHWWGQGLASEVVPALLDYVPGATHSPVAYVEGIYVQDEYRKQGIGAALIQSAQEWALEQGCIELASDALIDNTASHEFHLKIGFQEAERTIFFIKSIAKVSQLEKVQ